jgi:ribose transport system substrate-binding protein
LVTWNQSDFWDPVEAGAKEAAQGLGVELSFIRCNADASSQNKAIQDLIGQRVNALAVSPINPANQRAILDEVAGKAVLITFDSDAPEVNRKGFVGTNNYAAGQMAGEQVREALAEAIKVQPDIKCIVGLYGYSGPAIARAVEAAGKKGQIQIIAFDESAEVQSLIASGAIRSSILQNQYRCGYDSVRMLTDLLRGNAKTAPANPALVEMRVLVLKAEDIEEFRNNRVIRQVK